MPSRVNTAGVVPYKEDEFQKIVNVHWGGKVVIVYVFIETVNDSGNPHAQISTATIVDSTFPVSAGGSIALFGKQFSSVPGGVPLHDTLTTAMKGKLKYWVSATHERVSSPPDTFAHDAYCVIPLGKIEENDIKFTVNYFSNFPSVNIPITVAMASFKGFPVRITQDFVLPGDYPPAGLRIVTRKHQNTIGLSLQPDGMFKAIFNCPDAVDTDWACIRNTTIGNQPINGFIDKRNLDVRLEAHPAP